MSCTGAAPVYYPIRDSVLRHLRTSLEQLRILIDAARYPLNHEDSLPALEGHQQHCTNLMRRYSAERQSRTHYAEHEYQLALQGNCFTIFVVDALVNLQCALIMVSSCVMIRAAYFKLSQSLET